MIKERETEERRLCLRLGATGTDLASSKNLTDNLQAALDEKEKRVMELLGEKEQAVIQVFNIMKIKFLKEIHAYSLISL